MTGEKQGYRQAMDQMAKRMIEGGATREQAVKKSREAAIRRDRKEDNKNKK